MLPLSEIINGVLDTERKQRNLPNDNELARHLGIAPKTLSLWRNDKGLCKAARVLVPLVHGIAVPPSSDS